MSSVKNNTPNAILVPFVFSTTQAYMLEFGPSYIRFFKDRGIIFDVSYRHQRRRSYGARTTCTGGHHGAPAHAFANGDRIIITGVQGMTELNNREFTVSRQVGAPTSI